MKKMVIKYVGFISIIGIIFSAIYYLINKTSIPGIMSFSLALLMVSIYFDNNKNSEKFNKTRKNLSIIAFILNIIVGILQLIK